MIRDTAVNVMRGAEYMQRDAEALVVHLAEHDFRIREDFLVEREGGGAGVPAGGRVAGTKIDHRTRRLETRHSDLAGQSRCRFSVL